jgi:hypothetical protein
MVQSAKPRKELMHLFAFATISQSQPDSATAIAIAYELQSHLAFPFVAHSIDPPAAFGHSAAA